MSFPRYFEAIYAGYKESEDFLIAVCRRIMNTGRPPDLYKDAGDIDIYNGCLNHKK